MGSELWTLSRVSLITLVVASSLGFGDFYCYRGRCGGGLGGEIVSRGDATRGFAHMGGQTPSFVQPTPDGVWSPGGEPTILSETFVSGRRVRTVLDPFGHIVARQEEDGRGRIAFDPRTGISPAGFVRVSAATEPEKPAGTMEGEGTLVRGSDGWYQSSGGKLRRIERINREGTAKTQTSPGVFATVSVVPGDLIVRSDTGEAILADASTRKALLEEYRKLKPEQLARYTPDQQAQIRSVIDRQTALLGAGGRVPSGRDPLPPPDDHGKPDEKKRPEPVRPPTKFDEFKSIFVEKAKTPKNDALLKFLGDHAFEKTDTAQIHLKCVSSNDRDFEAKMTLYLGKREVVDPATKEKKARPVIRIAAGHDTVTTVDIEREWETRAADPKRFPGLRSEKESLVAKDELGPTQVDFELRAIDGDPPKYWVKVHRKTGTDEATYYCGKGEVKTKAEGTPPPKPEPEPKPGPEERVEAEFGTLPEGSPALVLLEKCAQCHSVEGRQEAGFAVGSNGISFPKSEAADAKAVAKRVKDAVDRMATKYKDKLDLKPGEVDALKTWLNGI